MENPRQPAINISDVIESMIRTYNELGPEKVAKNFLKLISDVPNLLANLPTEKILDMIKPESYVYRQLDPIDLTRGLGYRLGRQLLHRVVHVDNEEGQRQLVLSAGELIMGEGLWRVNHINGDPIPPVLIPIADKTLEPRILVRSTINEFLVQMQIEIRSKDGRKFIALPYHAVIKNIDDFASNKRSFKKILEVIMYNRSHVRSSATDS